MSSTPYGLFATTPPCSIDTTGTVVATSFTVSTTAPGQHYQVTLSDSASETASATFLVIAAISLSPLTGSPLVGSGSAPGGAPATTVTVSGTGFNIADSTAACQLTANSTLLVISSPSCSVNSATGQLTGSFTVGAGSIFGYYNVTATGFSGDAAGIRAQANMFKVVGSVVLSSTTGSIGSTIGVFGAGLSSITPVATQCDQSGKMNITGPPVSEPPTSCTKGADGTFFGSFKVTSSVIPSTYSVTYVDNGGAKSAGTYSQLFTVTSGPVISLSPNPGNTGQAITVSGSGFSSSDTSVSVTATGPSALFSPSSITCSVVGGTLSACTFTVGSLARGGSYTVTAIGNVANDPASAPFSLQATLILTPSSGAAGITVTMSGTGYMNTETNYASYSCVKTGVSPFSTPSGLFATSPAVACSISGNGTLTGSFTVASSAAYGSYTVTITNSSSVPQTTVTAAFNIGVPSIAFSPGSGGGGTKITISGSGFSSSDTTCTLTPPTYNPNVVTALACSISGGVVTGSFIVGGAGTQGRSGMKMTLTANTMDSATATFSVVPAITLTPNPAHLGSNVTVTGTNFGTAGGTCTISGLSVLPGSSNQGCKIATDWTLVSSWFVVNPSFTGASDTITVTDNSSPTNSSSTTLTIAVPTVVLSPSSGAVGASISVTGTGFDAGDSCPASLISGTPVNSTNPSPVRCSSASAGTISGSFIVLAGTAPGTYTVKLTGEPYGDVGSASFTVVPGLTLTPSSGGAGTSVVASGSNFALTDSGCTITSSPAGLVTNPVCTVSGGVMSGSFKVTSGASGAYTLTVTGTSGDAASISFSASAARTMTLTPTSGPLGTSVTISGSGFAGTSCLLSSSPGSLFTSSSCAISAGALSAGFTVGSGAAVGSYTVTATSNLGSTDSASASFTVTSGPASTFSLSPTSGPGGTSVTVSGSNFAGTTCTLSSAPSGLFSSTPTCSISGGTLTGSFTVATAASKGSYTVTVTTNVPSDTKAVAFTVLTPTLTLAPTSGPVGTIASASGANYAGTTCTLTSTPSGLFTTSTCSISSGTLTGSFTVASGASLGGYTVTVTTNVAGETGTASFIVESPGAQTLSLTPSSGPAGISVSASGQNYLGSTCSLTSTPSGLFTSSSCTISGGTLYGGFTVAAGASAGTYSVTVTTNTGETKGASFTVASPLTFSLTPTSGIVGTLVTAAGSNYAGTTCTLSASPSSLFTSQTCSISGGMLTGIFTVSPGAVPSTVYTVTVNTDAGESKSATFTVSSPATQTFVLTPASGATNSAVSISGTNYVGTTCTLSSAPAGLFTSSSCSISAGALSGGFTVATSASAGGYTVTVSTNKGEQLSTPFTVTGVSITGTPQCIIATVTFGSEAAPAVQFLRNFRDGLVVHTSAGSAFMTVFNAWYYSFSPQVAGFIAAHDPLRAPMRVILYPLLGILGLTTFAYSILSSAPEFGILIAGLLASSLIGLVYLTLPALLGMRALLKRRTVARARIAKISIASLATSLLLLAVGEVAGSFVLLAIGSSAVVLTCIIAVPVNAALAIMRKNPR